MVRQLITGTKGTGFNSSAAHACLKICFFGGLSVRRGGWFIDPESDPACVQPDDLSSIPAQAFGCECSITMDKLRVHKCALAN